jgi:hypothetical protein
LNEVRRAIAAALAAPAGLPQDIDPATNKPWRSAQCKQSGHRRKFNPRQGYSECSECGEVLAAPAGEVKT